MEPDRAGRHGRAEGALDHAGPGLVDSGIDADAMRACRIEMHSANGSGVDFEEVHRSITERTGQAEHAVAEAHGIHLPSKEHRTRPAALEQG